MDIHILSVSSLAVSGEPSSFYFAEAPTEVGIVYNFSSPPDGRGLGPEGCENCARQQETHALSTGQVILTNYLVEHIKKHTVEQGLRLESLSVDEVGAYLRKNLHWRITNVSYLNLVSKLVHHYRY